MFSIKVNGSLVGFFPGHKGLRQGDPLSPYLFVIIMEGLSLLLKQASSQPSFKFHPKTKACNLTHLCFADDLLLFYHGNPTSVNILKSSLDTFSLLSGLTPNPSKSQCFLSNVSASHAQLINNSLGFTVGSLPIKFLGVPLISSKLTTQDCTTLIQRITNRVTSWTNIFLSYAGRCTLIKSILFSIQAYWSNHFILPKAVLIQLQNVIRRFLWKGASLAKYGAKVAWNTVTLPYSEGGLGIKKLEEWNKALILQHLWHLIQFRPSSFWASWIHQTILPKKHFWTMPIPTDCSWIWRKILKLRSLAINHISYNIGTGTHISLWHDPWLHHRTLDQPLLISNSGLGNDATLNMILSNGTWSLPLSNHHEVINFRNNFNFLLPTYPSLSDQILWDGFNHNQLTATKIWHSIRISQPTVPWSRTVWHPLHVPRFSFVLWLACHRKLKTKDALIRMGMQVDPLCPLCKAAMESFDHLFFNCAYSSLVFTGIFKNCHWIQVPMDWSSILRGIQIWKGSKIRTYIINLCISAVTYKLWEERNARVFSSSNTPARVVAAETIHLVKCRLHSFVPFQKAALMDPSLSFWLL